MADVMHDDQDQPESREELGDTLARRPVTHAAYGWLRHEKLNLKPGLRETLVRKAEGLGRQLTLEETRAFEKSRREHIARLYDPKSDDSHPSPLACEWPLGCAHTVRPEIRNIVRKGKPATDGNGVRLRQGNFVLLRMKDGLPDKEGPLIRLGLCSTHLKEYGGESYSWRRAERLLAEDTFRANLPEARFSPMNGIPINGRA